MKIFRAYIITVIACISITSVAASIFIADENARKITLGEDYAVVVMNSSDEQRYDEAVNTLPMLEKLKSAAKKAASIAPPPFSNLYWIIFNAKNL